MKINKKLNFFKYVILSCLILINFNSISFAVNDAGGHGNTINVDGDEYPYSVQAEGMRVPIEIEQGKTLLWK